ncbi:hypothetical protein BsWGS_17018 [Bradybaena similaris]
METRQPLPRSDNRGDHRVQDVLPATHGAGLTSRIDSRWEYDLRSPAHLSCDAGFTGDPPQVELCSCVQPWPEYEGSFTRQAATRCIQKFITAFQLTPRCNNQTFACFCLRQRNRPVS